MQAWSPIPEADNHSLGESYELDTVRALSAATSDSSPLVNADDHQDLDNRPHFQRNKVSEDHHRTVTARKQASAWSRWFPLLASILSSLLNGALLALQASGKTYSKNSMLYQWTSNYLPYVTVIISIIAAGLALLWTLSVCGAFNMYMRIILGQARSPLGMNRMRLYGSISSMTPNLNLPRGLLSLFLSIYALSVVPARLWTGALTPDLTTKPYNDTFPVPHVPPPNVGGKHGLAFPNIDSDMTFINCTNVVQSNGTFLNCPARAYAGRIVDSMATITPESQTNMAWSHGKFDNTGFSYSGRSYGAGSSVGLGNPPNDTSSYNFIEQGHMVTSKCAYNSSTEWKGFAQNYGPDAPAWWINGSRPNENPNCRPWFGYQTISWGSDNMVALNAGSSGSFRNGTPPYQLCIAGTSDFAALDTLLCNLSFVPMNFSVNVSIPDQNIRVTPMNDSSMAVSGQPYLIEWVLKSFQSLALIQTALYVSVVGEAFRSSIARRTGPSFEMRTKASDPRVFSAIQDSVNAGLDDVLMALNSFSLTNSIGWSSQPAQFNISVVRVGSPGFTYVLFAYNLIPTLIILGLSISTRCFRDAPALDFSELLSMAAATARIPGWNGDPTHSALTAARMTIDSRTGVDKAPSITVLPTDQSMPGEESKG